jgi:replication-associated recombination protein RarA
MTPPDLFADDSARSSIDSSSQSLSEKYRPKKISDFIGLNRPKTILQAFAARPYSKAWLFVGPTGIGKTSMGFALASEIEAEMHYLSAPHSRGQIEHAWAECQGFPRPGYKRHLIFVDNIDLPSKTALTTLLAKLDARQTVPDIIWVFACSNTEKLGDRFPSFCGQIKFSKEGISKEAAALLKRVWEAERGQVDAVQPNFARIVKDNKNDIRAALMNVHLKLMATNEDTAAV